MKGGNDFVVSRDGGDIITLGNNADGDVSGGKDTKGVSTVRIYPTHDKDHVFGQKDDSANGDCTIIKDATELTNIELVIDDPWHPDGSYHNDDDYCSLLLHGWELRWYFHAQVPDAWADDTAVPLHVFFSRQTGEASFCVGAAAFPC